MRVLILVLSLLLAASSVRAAVSPAIEVSAATFEGLPRIEVKASVHEQESLWSGVSLAEVLKRADAPFGKRLRGDALTQVVRVTAADGYRVAFTLAELDESFGNRQVLLVDRQDGKPLSAEDGPYRLVVVGDKRGARMVRQVIRIEIIEVSGKP